MPYPREKVAMIAMHCCPTGPVLPININTVHLLVERPENEDFDRMNKDHLIDIVFEDENLGRVIFYSICVD